MAVATQIRTRGHGRGPTTTRPTLARSVRIVDPGPRSRPSTRGVQRGAAVLAAAVVVATLLLTVAANAYLTQGQVLLARLQQQVAVQVDMHRDLELQVAQLEDPSHLVAQAEHQGLVAPTEVGDLAQVDLQAPSSVAVPRGAPVISSHSVPSVAVAPAGTGR